VSRPRLAAVIPVRMTATRLPGKPLLDLGGRTVVERVLAAAVGSGVFDDVVVATDDDRIAEVVRASGGTVVMTSSDHVTGSERVAEAAEHLDADVVANVQGDQPFVTAQMLEVLVRPYRKGSAPEMTTVGCPLRDAAQAADPSVVKVVRALDGSALYFTRSAVPHGGATDPSVVLHHMGLYAFRSDFLRDYAAMAPTPLERAESLEQLRVLEHGHLIAVGEVPSLTLEINTPEDYALAQALVAAGGAPWQQ
jgi:3-deoxy-manno-octulosonate cytidylyltransferase (CMP-KDO synthetase)